MLLLALDTATAVSRVALVGDTGVSVEVTTTDGPGDGVVALIARLLAQQGVSRSQLTHVGVGVGPGPYTSTRIGVMIAVTVGAALGIPVVGICSLDAIARGVRSAARGSAGEPVFGVATDARRKEVYWALYDAHGSRVAGPAVNKPAQLLADVGCRSWAGNGFDRYRLLADQNGVQLLQPSTPSAAVLGGMVIEGLVRGEQPRAMLPNVGAHSGDGAGSIAKGDRLLAPYPLYLRRPDAVEPATGVGVVHA